MDAIGLLAAVMLRVCLVVGSGVVLMLLAGVSAVVALVGALAGVVVRASVSAAGLGGRDCCCMPVDVGDGFEPAAASDSPHGTAVGSIVCCLGGLLMPIDRSVPPGACGFLLPAAGSPPEVGAEYSSSLSDSYMVRCVMGG